MDLPCLDGEPCTGGKDASGRPVNQVRAPDGVHFCPVTHAPAKPCPVYASGAMRFALSVVVPVLHAVVGRLDHPVGRPPSPDAA